MANSEIPTNNSPSPAPSHALRKTPLHQWHVANGGRMVPFAGYELPVHYRTGLMQEHLHTRSAAGLFDVSQMGTNQVFVSGDVKRPNSYRVSRAGTVMTALYAAGGPTPNGTMRGPSTAPEAASEARGKRTTNVAPSASWLLWQTISPPCSWTIP